MIGRYDTTARGLIAVMAMAAIGCRQAPDTTNMNELQRVKTATLNIVLLSTRETLRQGKDTFSLEFRAVSDNHLVDVGDVRGRATMPMAGTPMFGSLDVRRTSVPGRYAGSSELSMAGSWRVTLEWHGAAGQGSVSFTGSVQ